MTDNIKAKEIKLQNGCKAIFEGRTIMSETGLDPDAQLEKIGSRSRKTGTGCKDTMYRICGTDDMLLIEHNAGPQDDFYLDIVSIERGYFAERREYGWKATKLSRKYHIPFEVAVVLGTNEEVYHQFLFIVSDVDGISIRTIRNLRSGIERRKIGLYTVLGKELYDALEIEKMGQKHSKSIAEYIVSNCLARIENV